MPCGGRETVRKTTVPSCQEPFSVGVFRVFLRLLQYFDFNVSYDSNFFFTDFLSLVNILDNQFFGQFKRVGVVPFPM